MKLGVVRGAVVATAKHPDYEGRRVLLVDLVDPAGAPLGNEVVAVDLVQSGPGDLVLVMHEGNSARFLLGDDLGPLLDLIVAVVDHVERDE